MNENSKMKLVFCLDTGKGWYFLARDAVDALQKMLYTLNLAKEDKSAFFYEGQRANYLEHCGKTYGAVK